MSESKKLKKSFLGKGPGGQSFMDLYLKEVGDTLLKEEMSSLLKGFSLVPTLPGTPPLDLKSFYLKNKEKTFLVVDEKVDDLGEKPGPEAILSNGVYMGHPNKLNVQSIEPEKPGKGQFMPQFVPPLVIPVSKGKAIFPSKPTIGFPFLTALPEMGDYYAIIHLKFPNYRGVLLSRANKTYMECATIIGSQFFSVTTSILEMSCIDVLHLLYVYASATKAARSIIVQRLAGIRYVVYDSPGPVLNGEILSFFI